MRKEALPKVCPTCGGPNVVRILWGYSTLSGEEEQGLVLLGLNYRYLRPVTPGDLAPKLLLESSRLPAWGCLDCNPRWVDLHRLTLKQWEADASKSAAVTARSQRRNSSTVSRTSRPRSPSADGVQSGPFSSFRKSRVLSSVTRLIR